MTVFITIHYFSPMSSGFFFFFFIFFFLRILFIFLDIITNNDYIKNKLAGFLNLFLVGLWSLITSALLAFKPPLGKSRIFIMQTKYEIRPVVGYERKYSVSNTGQVFSHNYMNTGQTRELKPTKNIHGYFRAALCKDGQRKNHFIHRLVLQAFVPNPDNKPECDHIDTNPINNHVSNLRWATSKENSNNPLTKEKSSKVNQGEKHPNYDTTIYIFKNKKTNEVFVGERYDFIAKYNLDKGHVSRLVHDKLNHFKGWVLI